MKKILTLLLFFNAVNSNTFKIKNDFFEVEGSCDNKTIICNNKSIITYAKLKECNQSPVECSYIEANLKSISSKKETSIESLKEQLQKAAEDIDKEEYKNASLLIWGSLTVTSFFIAPSNMDNKDDFLYKANITNRTISRFISNKSLLNGPLINADFIFCAVNFFFMTKAIIETATGVAGQPTSFFMPVFLGLNIMQNIATILYRQSEQKTTVTFTKHQK